MISLLQFSNLGEVQLPAKPLHLAVGMFDGMHRGHQSVIALAVEAARRDCGISAVLTFWPHPSALFRPEDPTRLIMTPEAKAKVLKRSGVDVLITQSFTLEFAAIKAENFLPELKRHLPHLAVIYVGENWRFGRGRIGDVSLLVQIAASLGLTVISLPRVSNEEDETISSTKIRSLIVEGEIAQANQMLGYPYFGEGEIIPGKGLGRTIGFPTLNLNWKPELMPRFGVYAVKIFGGEQIGSLSAVANYGVRPTVEDTLEPRLEVHVLADCSFNAGDLVTVEFLQFLRPEQKFKDVAALQAQIEIDRDSAMRWFGSVRQ